MNAYEFIIQLKNYASSELKKVTKELGVVSKMAGLFNKKLKETRENASRLGNSLGGLRGKLVGLFAGLSLMAFGQQVVNARAEYEKFDAVLTNTFQNKDIGQGALAMLTDFATKTPYQLNELTDSFVKLVNRGVYPTRDEMTSLGDLAASQGKSFNQLTEAILDAQTGEFERMKEFGIRASKSGDKVALTFKGVTHEVAMNDKAIKEAIISYGKMEGVAGSMDVISKTLGGRLSNLSDAWWGFLVAVGGYSGGILGEGISLIGEGLEFLQAHLPQIAHWFNQLWSYLSPLVKAVKDFISAMFGIKGAGDILSTFGDIMSDLLVVVNWFSIGLRNLLNWLEPIAPVVKVIIVSWLALNAAFAISPIGWIVIGIMALITVIGMVIKYTDGWGKSFNALTNILKLAWQLIKADFQHGVDTGTYHLNRLRYSAFEIFDKIAQKASNVGQAIKQALELDFEGAFKTLNKEITSQYTDKLKDNQKQYEAKSKAYNEKIVNGGKQIKKEWENVGISIDTEGMKKDFEGVKKSFKGLNGQQTGDVSAYESFLGKNGKLGAKGNDGGGNDGKAGKTGKSKDGIVSGGSKQTNIVINIDKVGTDTKIYVSSKEEGLSSLGEKVKEELLRAVNSVNQLQTG